MTPPPGDPPDPAETDWKAVAERARIVGIRARCDYSTALVLVTLDDLHRTLCDVVAELSRLSGGEDDGWKP